MPAIVAPKRWLLWAEFVLLFGGGPLLILLLRRPGILFLLLWAGAVLAWFTTRALGRAAVSYRTEALAILRRLAVLAPCLVLLSWLLLPQDFFALPLHRPVLWLAIMVLYPALSVWPQEMIFRSFLFHRYGGIFGQGGGAIAASALAFGYAHIIFLNWFAVFLTTAGGAMFARDYARHRSLRLACGEHALYGCLIFTIGLGRFFYTGAAWHH